MSAEVTCDQTCHFATARGGGFSSFSGYMTNGASAYQLSGKPLHFRFADTFTSSHIYSEFVVDSSDQP